MFIVAIDVGNIICEFAFFFVNIFSISLFVLYAIHLYGINYFKLVDPLDTGMNDSYLYRARFLTKCIKALVRVCTSVFQRLLDVFQSILVNSQIIKKM